MQNKEKIAVFIDADNVPAKKLDNKINNFKN